MSDPRLRSLRGSNARRARALARQPKRPRFRLGELVVNSYDDVGVVHTIYADFHAAVDAGVVDGDEWWRKQQRRPRTPQSGIWYGLIFGEGAALAGEDDLRRVRKPRTKRRR